MNITTIVAALTSRNNVDKPNVPPSETSWQIALMVVLGSLVGTGLVLWLIS